MCRVIPYGIFVPGRQEGPVPNSTMALVSIQKFDVCFVIIG